MTLEPTDGDGSGDTPRWKQELTTRPWWGYTCVCLGGIFAIFGGADLLRFLTGINFSWLQDLTSLILVPALLACLVCILAAKVFRQGPAPSSRPLIKIAGYLFAGGIACSMLGMLGPATDAASQAAAAARIDTHAFAGGRGEVQVPGNWQQKEEMSRQMGSLIMFDPQKDLHMAVSGIMKVDSASRSFDRFASQATSRFKSQLNRSKVVETRQSTAGKFNFGETRIESVIEDTKVHYLMRYVECGDLWVEARVWSTPSIMQENQQMAEQILDSIGPAK
jgi:hypothetical protein